MDLMGFVMVMDLIEKIDMLEKAVQIFIYTRGRKYFLSLQKLDKGEEVMYRPVYSGTVGDFYNSGFYKKMGAKKSKGLGSGM
jgi:hypothetical protein